MSFFVWFNYQVLERVRYYQTHPVTVDMNIAYNNSLEFPSVAICNTNQFRMSKAWEAGIYRKLEVFYGADAEARRNITNLDDRNMTQTLLDMAHTKEDLIKKCTWKGHYCSYHNFTQLVTDFGVCYIFNDLQANESVRDPSDYEVENTGASFGLQLYLNAEEYERSPGPRLPAGIQVLIFNGNDRPRVLDLGTAASVFEISRAALHVSSMSRLSDPYGDCASKILRDFKVYSFQSCLAEIFTNATAEQCGCIGYGQRWVGPDRPPYCNFSTKYGCYHDVNARSFTHSCTHSCKRKDYTTTLSKTGLSTTSIGALLDVIESDATLLAKKEFRPPYVTK
ncbi:acid-sensing ion channel 5-like [Lineus longissimus]|uniref:acid-sensing ion channel 5-like n=1 Tax=Lineus longissimus TaxID=88925 RepID=UPI00315CEAFB